MMFWGFSFQSLKKTVVTKDAMSLLAPLQMLARNILGSAILKWNAVDVKLHGLPLDGTAFPGHWSLSWKRRRRRSEYCL